jgi:hypothetical protein
MKGLSRRVPSNKEAVSHDDAELVGRRCQLLTRCYAA